ncbi:PIN domain-containing protein [Variovorax paradoxus]|uniref:PIN domain-containing protein n=1 Tax=Variovorax paradoxus TaxID=34073 RepID=UPI003ECF5296
MKKSLLLVDLENVHKVDLSLLDESFRAIIYVGAKQNPPRAATKKSTAHRFVRADFHKVEGSGKNALDFHIAFQLGRTFETAPDTECYVLSKDKGFDPLLAHLNKNGLRCQRVNSLDELLPMIPATIADLVVCGRCRKSSTIDHYGGKWCTNCGSFASPPDQKLLPSQQPGFEDRSRSDDCFHEGIVAECGYCYRRTDMTGGIYDDGEWMCAGCIDRYATFSD